MILVFSLGASAFSTAVRAEDGTIVLPTIQISEAPTVDANVAKRAAFDRARENTLPKIGAT